MKKIITVAMLLTTFMFLSGCGLMEGAFKAGFIIALILAAAIGLLIWILSISWKFINKHFPPVRLFSEYSSLSKMQTKKNTDPRL
ncbi:hypothetical protein ACFQZX_17485 [Mucilaginibacter litoreus]|uniref:Lipoprotein n=1 Tax=Mucilaginibacter litoreus TaxID=1048221 RepID=A0ABW3AYD1_9SPHI